MVNFTHSLWNPNCHTITFIKTFIIQWWITGAYLLPAEAVKALSESGTLSCRHILAADGAGNLLCVTNQILIVCLYQSEEILLSLL